MAHLLQGDVMVFFGLLPFVILFGIVVVVVRLIDQRGGTTSDGAGVSVRRIFQYLVMLVTLVLSCIGLSELLSELTRSGDQITRDTAAVARSVSFLVVGLPAFVTLAFYTRRRLRDDPDEVQSAGWAIYLTLVLVGSLVAIVALSITLFGDLLVGDGVDGEVAVNMVIWGAVWGVHRWISTRDAYAPDLWFEHLFGSFIGLATILVAGAVTAANVLVEIYDAVFDIAGVGPSAEQIVRPLVAVAVGAVVWVWYWLRTALRDERRILWVGYVLFAGVLSGVVLVASGIGTALFRVLEWFLADPSGSAAAHFEVVPAAIGVAAVGAATWGYHRFVLDSGERERMEVDRVYDYLLAGAGLVVAAGGLTTLVVIALWAVAGTEITGSDRGATAVALTLLLVGGPLWGIYWTRAQRERRRSPDEARSTTRRVYLFAVLGISGLVALVSLISLVYLLVQAVLDSNVGAGTLDDTAVPIGFLATAGALAWYHFTLVRQDRAAAPAPPRSAVREVILITSDAPDITHALTAAGIRVRTFRASADPVDRASVDDVLAALGGETHQRVVVVAGEGGGFTVIPLA